MCSLQGYVGGVLKALSLFEYLLLFEWTADSQQVPSSYSSNRWSVLLWRLTKYIMTNVKSGHFMYLLPSTYILCDLDSVFIVEMMLCRYQPHFRLIFDLWVPSCFLLVKVPDWTDKRSLNQRGDHKSLSENQFPIIYFGNFWSSLRGRLVDRLWLNFQVKQLLRTFCDRTFGVTCIIIQDKQAIAQPWTDKEMTSESGV